MPIFQIKGKKLKRIKEKTFVLEKDLQILTEQNLQEVFDLEFVCGKLNKQLVIKNFEIDTLAFDPESKSFVIIEYKKDESFSVVDQGLSYLSLMLNNKADFVLKYNERTNNSLKKKDIDWSQSKVCFIAPKFTAHQISAVSFRDFPTDLWKVKIYENNIVEYDLLEPSPSAESIKTIIRGKKARTLTREIREYQTSDLIKTTWKKTINLFQILEDSVLKLHFPDSRKRVLKFYIAYHREGEPSFLEVVPQQTGLKLYIRPKISELQNKGGFLLRDCSKVGHWTNGNTYFKATTDYEVIEFIKFVKNVVVKDQ